MFQFKHRFSLVDTTGHAIAEPFEEDLQQISSYRRCLSCAFGICHTIVAILLVGYAIFRFYIYSCYHQFQALTIADLKHEPFPISDYHLARIVERCDHTYGGTGVEDGHGIACRPSDDQILNTCQSPPPLQPRPTAFTHVVNEIFGTTIEGAKCFEGLCEFRAQLLEWDFEIVLACVFLVLATFVLRFLINECIRGKKSRLQQDRANNLKASRKEQQSKLGLLLNEDDSP